MCQPIIVFMVFNGVHAEVPKMHIAVVSAVGRHPPHLL